MKKLLLLLCMPILLFGCAETPDTDEPRDPNYRDPNLDYGALTEVIGEPATSNRTESEAVTLAIAAADYNYPAKSRSNVGHRVSGVRASVAPNSRSETPDTLFYVVNFEDEAGFALIAAPRTLSPVLAVVESGNYELDEEIDNPGFKLFMDCLPDYIESASINAEIDPDIRPADRLITDTLTHWGSRDNFRVGVEWGQDGIYGAYCPNGICGCAPLAIGTIAMRLGNTNMPNFNINYTFPERDIDSETLVFTEMNRHRGIVKPVQGNEYEYRCWADDEEATDKSIGRMLRQIGMDCGSKYYSNETGTNKGVYTNILKKYLPYAQVSELKEYKSRELISVIDKGLAMMRAGEDNYGGGHAWVADGYEYLHTRTTVWTWNKLTMRFEPTSTSYEKITSVTHFRWGWHGDKDGYFEGDVFNVGSYKFVSPEYIAVLEKY